MSDLIRYLSGRERFIGWGIEWPTNGVNTIPLPPAQYAGVILWGDDRTFYYSDGNFWLPLLEKAIDTPSARAPTNAREQTQLKLSNYRSRQNLVHTATRYEVATGPEFTAEQRLFTRTIRDIQFMDQDDPRRTTYQITADDGLSFGQMFWWRAVYISDTIESDYSVPFLQQYPKKFQDPRAITPSETVTNNLEVTEPETAFPTDYFYTATEYVISTDPEGQQVIARDWIFSPEGQNGIVPVDGVGLLDGVLYYWRVRHYYQGLFDQSPDLGNPVPGWTTEYTDVRSFFVRPKTLVFTFDTEIEAGLGLFVGLALYGDGVTPMAGIIEWGDGTVTDLSILPDGGIYTPGGTYSAGSNVPDEVGQFQSPGRYTVRVSVIGPCITRVGDFNFSNAYVLSQRKLVSVDALGNDMGIRNLSWAFHDCRNLVRFPRSLPETNGTGINSLYHTFEGCLKFNVDVSKWDVSRVTSFQATFANCRSFNGQVSQWDMTSAVDMRSMFLNCENFDQPVNNWGDTFTQLEDVNNLFYGCAVFNQNLDKWAQAMSSIQQTRYMFYRCFQFSGNVDNWQLSSLKDATGMFRDCQRFNRTLAAWDVSQVEDMTEMFMGCLNYEGTGLDQWDVSNVELMDRMLRDCPKLNVDIAGWNVSSVTSFNGFLYNAGYTTRPSRFNGDLSNWQLDQAVDTAHMFYGCTAFEGKGLNLWSTGNIRDMSGMFQGCFAFNTDISGWDVSGVGGNGSGGLSNGGMAYMFANCESFQQDLSSWDTTKVRTVEGMFVGCTRLGLDDPNNPGTPLSVNVGHWFDPASPGYMPRPTSLYRMFERCVNFNEDLSNWRLITGPGRTDPVTRIARIFRECGNFNNGDVRGGTAKPGIGNWEVDEVTDFHQTFYFCTDFNQDVGNWNVSKGTIFSHMFYVCESFVQDLSAWRLNEARNCSGMFMGATEVNFNVSDWFSGQPQPPVLNELGGMFYSATNFNNGMSLGSAGTMSWPTSEVKGFNYTFYNTPAFNQNVSSWDTGNAERLYSMFHSAIRFNNGGDPGIGNWNVSKATNMEHMFYNAQNFNQNLDNWVPSQCINMNGLFRLAYDFNNGRPAGDRTTPLAWGGIATARVATMNRMFESARSFTQSLASFNTQALTSAAYMFYNNPNYAVKPDIDIPSPVVGLKNWFIPLLVDMEGMFSGSSAANTAKIDPEELTAIYQAWAQQASAPAGIQRGAILHVGDSSYTAAGVAARAVLTEDRQWAITGDKLA